jgi:hypothetical protein
MKAPKPLDIPPKVARAFVKDMKAFFAEETRIKRDEIAACCTPLRQHQGPREEAVHVTDRGDRGANRVTASWVTIV